MRVWAWIAIGLAVAALAFLVSPLVQIQTELRLANEQVVQARAGIAELERVVANLKTELDAANQARTQLQSGLDEANAEIKKGQSEIERLSTELENATNLAKDAEAPDQKEGSAAESSDGWQPR
jgi:septal ring factor EnvC (AmiA/AmiB activator)